MGLIKEPKNIDFYVLDKQWTDKEKKELSDYIAIRKAKSKKRSTTIVSGKLTLKS